MNDLSFILERLQQLYRRMDAAYQETALAYGFICNGCADNCCRSRFFHHTVVEHLMLHEGLARLPAGQHAELLRRAQGHPGAPAVCPLIQAERCLLYDYRPMICRLHGIPHCLQLPDGRVQAGPGCADFEARRGPAMGVRLDRTPLYQALAELEQSARRWVGFTGKRRMTIAEMIATAPILPDHPAPDEEVR